MKDTYDRLADGIRQLLRALAEVEGVGPKAWAAEHGYERHLASSIKGEAEVDWDDEGSRRAFVQGIVEDADRLLALAQEVMASLAEGAAQREGIQRAGALLVQLVDQDVERSAGGVQLKDGVARDRIVSVHDPEHALSPAKGSGMGARAARNGLTGTRPPSPWTLRAS